jgi:hypothetical protein
MKKMTKANMQLAALSMDLKRVAMAAHNRSQHVADRFIAESIAEKNRIDITNQKPHIRAILTNLVNILSQKDTGNLSEDALLYSILLQNAALKQ